jgi:hypothetical protein
MGVLDGPEDLGMVNHLDQIDNARGGLVPQH